MNVKSKIVSFSSAVFLALTFAGTSFAAPIQFSDLTDVAAKDKILELQAKGYVNGVADGLFAPNRAIIASEGVALIVKAFGLNLDRVRFIKEPKATDYYQKANDKAWYRGAFITAAVNGLEFPKELDPNQEWTHEEFTYYLIKTMEKQGNLPMIKLAPAKIADEDQLSSDYSGAIQRALSYQIVQLDAEKRFNPKAKISRKEAAEQIYNALEYLKVHSAPSMK